MAELTKEIKLNRNAVAIVDATDFEWLSQFKWRVFKNRNKLYAVSSFKATNGEWNDVLMHRLILDAESNTLVDHINENGLDNRRQNLRLANHHENQYNRSAPKSNTSGAKGVYWETFTQKWRAKISFNGITKSLGRFDDKLDAIQAYNEAAKEFHGEFARLNS